MLFIAAGYNINHDSSAALIHEYFGCSNSQDLTLTIGNAVYWTSAVSLPRVEDDPLLFMLLTNSPNQASFMLNNERVPYRLFLHAMRNSEYYRSDMIFSNHQKRAKDGMLEALTCGAVCAASHMGGLAGVPFWTFLQELVYELSLPPPSAADNHMPMATTPQSIPVALFAPGQPCHRFMSVIIPYLSPPNQEWPEYVSSHFNVQRLERVKNICSYNIQCVSVGETGVSIEDKSQVRSCSSGELVEIFSKIPMKSSVHLVVVKTLQRSYFKKTFAREKLDWNAAVKKNSKLKNALVLVIDTNTSQCLEVPGLTDASLAALTGDVDRLILFLGLDVDGRMTDREMDYNGIKFPAYRYQGIYS